MFNPTIRTIVEHVGDDIDALVYASDMGFWDDGEMEEPPFPVLFARTEGASDMTPKFGMVVDICAREGRG